MLALRATMRCSATATKLSRTTLNSFKLIQNSPGSAIQTPQIAVHRNAGTFYLQSQPAFMNGYLLHRRHFATNTKDNIDTPELQRIYYGSLAPRMKAVKVFSLTTSAMGLAAQPILMEQGTKLGGTGLAVFLCGIAGIFTFVTPLLLHFITKKYVTEIHYNPATDEYVATTISIFLQKVETKFRPCDVKVPDVPGMFTSFEVANKPLFVDPAVFDDPEHYVRIMGYDKPVDFKLELSETPDGVAIKESKSK